MLTRNVCRLQVQILLQEKKRLAKIEAKIEVKIGTSPTSSTGTMIKKVTM